MSAAHQPLNLATTNALDVVTAWLAATPSAVLVLSDNPALQDPLTQRLALTPGLKVLLPDDHGDGTFSLLIAQPSKSDLPSMKNALHSPHLHQVIHLQPTWTGRWLLPELRVGAHSRPQQLTRILTNLSQHDGWDFHTRAIGSLRCLLWGALSGRMLTCNRPDLMDWANARMRRYLFPAQGPAALTYLRVSRWVKAQGSP